MQNYAARKRKPRIPGNNPNNPNYKKLRAKMIAKRARRQEKRLLNGKKPLAEPLEMITGEEQQKANANGFLVLRNGQEKTRIPLTTRDFNKTLHLQGVYKLPQRRLAVLRSDLFGGEGELTYFIRKPNGKEEYVPSFFFRLQNIAHVFLNEGRVNNMGLGIMAAAKADKEFRAIGGNQPIFVSDKVRRVFEKLHYKETKNKEVQHFLKNKKQRHLMEKRKEAHPRNDMRQNHVIDAIDPTTGKIRAYLIPIKE